MSQDTGTWYTAADLAGLPGLPGTDRGLRKLAEREGWPSRSRAKGFGLEYPFNTLPSPAQAALLLRERPLTGDLTEGLQDTGITPRLRRAAPSADELASRSTRFARLPASYRAEAHKRLTALLAVQTLVREGQPLTAARELVVARLQSQGDDCAPITLYRWAKLVEGVPRPQWLHYLAPHYVGRTATADCSPEAWDAFRADYLRPEAPPASDCYDRLQRLAKAHGWTVPSLKTLQRRIDAIAPAVRVLAREGEEALMRLFPAQERDHGVFHALEAVNADGHKIDVFVRHPLGHICRPILLGWHDIYSGKVLAWRWGETESADLVAVRLRSSVPVATSHWRTLGCGPFQALRELMGPFERCWLGLELVPI